jgi:hypothetical protein
MKDQRIIRITMRITLIMEKEMMIQVGKRVSGFVSWLMVIADARRRS